HHSITSSARASSVDGISRPIARAVGKVNDQFKLGRPHYREVGRLGTLEDFAGVDTGLTVPFCLARSIAHQAAGLRKVAQRIECGNQIAPPAWRFEVACLARTYQRQPTARRRYCGQALETQPRSRDCRSLA